LSLKLDFVLNNDPINEIKERSKSLWSLGSYGDIASYLPPMSDQLVRAAGVSRDDSVLDLACGTGVTTITARKTGAKVTGLDITPQLLVRAKQEASIAGIQDIDWKEGDAQDLPFSDNSFDVVLSSLGHIFATIPDVTVHELVRVTKVGGRIAFATWPPEHAVGKIFAVMDKYVSSTKDYSSNVMQWGIPDVIQKHLGNMVKNIHFERGALNLPLLSPNHYWNVLSTKFGPIINVIQTLENESEKIESLRTGFVDAIVPFIHGNILRLDYLITVSKKV